MMAPAPLSVVIPAHNEAGCIVATLRGLHARRSAGAAIDHEIVVVDDHSSDGTGGGRAASSPRDPAAVRLVVNEGSGGFGMAVRAGSRPPGATRWRSSWPTPPTIPQDLVTFVRAMERTGADCVFGSRFAPGGRVIDYPRPSWS